MTVARRLQSAFVVFVVLIAVVVLFQLKTIRAAAESGHALTEISSRLRITSTDQLTRISQISDDAEKFLVTRDAAYIDRAAESAKTFGRELARLNSLELTVGERTALVALATVWQSVAPVADSLTRIPDQPFADAQSQIGRFRESLESVAAGTRQLGVASQDAMNRELEAVEEAATAAERVSIFAAVAALILMVLLSAQLVRSIVGPLGRLAEGTKQVSAGRFDHRLDSTGDDELAQVARDFNSMTERLDELDRLKREFVAKVSHDLKTPLSSMQETTAALLDEVAGPLSEKQKHLLALNLESNQRLATMLSKLLDLSHLEAGLEPRHQTVNVNQIVGGAVDRLATSASRGASRISFLAPDRPLEVIGDPHALAQVVDNLLENAIKFSPPGAIVKIRVGNWPSDGAVIPDDRAAAFRWRGARPNAVLLSVVDEGPGIPDAEKERVFARFYQTEAGRAVRGRGVGLGLAICREIVVAHGGMVWVSDNEPRGSIFSVLLPAVPAVNPAGTLAVETVSQ